VTSTTAARTAGERTITNRHGWRFSALGAWVAARRIVARSPSSTGSGV